MGCPLIPQLEPVKVLGPCDPVLQVGELDAESLDRVVLLGQILRVTNEALNNSRDDLSVTGHLSRGGETYLEEGTARLIA